MTKVGDIFYREDDGYGDDIRLSEFRVFSVTPRGAWIVRSWDREGNFKRFVLEGLGRRHAYPTKELARDSYIQRKKRQIQHAARQHDRAKRLLHLAETGELPTPEYFQFDIPTPSD